MDKKTLIIVALVFVGSFSATYFLLKKNKPASAINIENYIPISSNGVIGAINYEAIESIVKTEMFRNPLELMDLKNNFSGNQFAGYLVSAIIKGGIDKEQKIIFSIAQANKKRSFVLIAIKDSARISEHLMEQLINERAVKLNIKETAFSNYYPTEQIGLVLDEHFLLIAYAEKEKATALWRDITTQKNCYPTNFKGVDSIINNEHHISIWTDKTSLVSSISDTSKNDNEWIAHLDFLDGELVVSASLTTDVTYFSNTPIKSYAIDSSAFSLHVNVKNLNKIPNIIDPTINLQIDSFCQLFDVHYPAILNYSNGKIDLNIIGKGVKSDKIITYEFDDDFNKVKKEKIILSPVVNFVLSIGNKEESLYSYLKQQGNIKLDNNEAVFANPVGKCYVKTTTEALILLSNKELALKKIKSDTNGIYLIANLDKLLPLFLKKENKQLAVFKSVRLRGNQKDTTLTFKLHISSIHPKKNILFDLMGVKMK